MSICMMQYAGKATGAVKWSILEFPGCGRIRDTCTMDVMQDSERGEFICLPAHRCRYKW